MIRKIMYIVHTRLDIVHALGIVAIFSANLKELHMTDVKRIMTYLKNVEDYGLLYNKEGKFEL